MNGSKFVQYFTRVVLVIGSIAVLAMMIVITANIAGRIFFKAPILGAIEIAGLTGAVLAAVALPYTEWEHRNVVVEVIANLFPPRVRGFMDALTLLISLLGVGVLSWAMFNEAFHAASFAEKTLVLRAPTPPFKFIWAIGTLLLFIVILRNIVAAIRRGVKR
jgi:TRAP-type C4-dicarboxylate transport system permease small subunit